MIRFNSLKKRPLPLLTAVVIAAASVISLIQAPQNALAESTDQIANNVRLYLNYKAILSCAYQTSNPASKGQIANWQFFDNNGVQVGNVILSNNREVGCQDTNWVSGVLGQFGYTDPTAFLCAAGWKAPPGGNGRVGNTGCPNPSGDLEPASNNADATMNDIKNTLLKNHAEPTLNSAEKYYLYSQTFIIGCQANQLGKEGDPAIPPAPSNNKGGGVIRYLLKYVGSDYVPTNYVYQGLTSTTLADQEALKEGNAISPKCSDLVAQANDLAQAYADAIKPGVGEPGTCGERYPIASTDPPIVAQRNACDDGFNNKDDKQFCAKYDPTAAGPLSLGALSPDGKTTFGIPTHFTDTFYACMYGQSTATGGANDTTPPPGSASQSPGGGKTSCSITGIGWLVCPIMNFVAGLVDGAYSFIASMLTIQPILQDGKSKGIYDAWSIMRNFANIAFVIAFLIIIFSQVTSLGITNYGIKRMLPRLIVAAILVNASYWICAAAVDVSNILGASIKSLFEGIGVNIAFLQPAGGASSGSNTWLNIVGAVLSGSVAGVALFALPALIPMLGLSLVIIISVLFALVLRQVLVILLIVISPLAFVAYLLPGTESLFKKWRTSFQMLLLMYPTIALLFGASALASVIIKGSGI